MIIIDLNGGINGITVDSNTITVDNNNSSIGYTIKFIPRYFTEDIKLIFRNELNDIETIIETTMININGICYCSFGFDIEDKTTFELTILNSINNDLLYRGKVFATFDINLENYTMNKPDINNKIIM